jgi:Cu+-exporting ATPase
MSTTELGIRGMTCASCVAHVTRALRRVPGVEDASVNLATERATVLHAPDTHADTLIAAVERAGYQATDRIDDDADAAERAQQLRRKRAQLVLAVTLAVPAVIIAMALPDFPYKAVLLGALAIPVWAIAGFDFHRNALAALRSGSATMDTLVSLGSTAAVALSVANAIAGRETYFETAAAIIALVSVGKYLEVSARSRSGSALRALLALRPTLAHRRDESGAIAGVPVDFVREGDVLLVAPGERIPVDGVVLEGAGTIDRSTLTGEATPDDAEPGSPVEQGTLNGDGALVIRATRVGAGTELARIIEIVRRAQGSTPPVQRLADRISSVFVPAIVGIALLTFAGWLVAHRSPSAALLAAVAVLVVACPCALGLATPSAIIAGIGVAAKRGVLFKDAGAMERAAAVDTVVFDKTGTLTSGRPQVLAATSAQALAVAAALERSSSHPLARAIVEHAGHLSLALPEATDVAASRGFGMTGIVAGSPAFAGNEAFLETHGITVPSGDESRTSVHVARDGAYLGCIAFGDNLRAQARQTILDLDALGVGSVLVSGDREAPVRRVAESAGIPHWHASATPARKAEIVGGLQHDGRRVAFLGDGINDAPALATADLGVAMGEGAAIALETAGAALLSGDPHAVVDALRIARATMRTIEQNLFWAFAYNVVLVPLAAFGAVTPMLAAAAMGCSSLFVVGNALRLSISKGR